MLETKCFGGSLKINEYGEFSVKYPNQNVYGIPSPVEQSRRHQKILAKLLGRLGITGRVSREPEFQNVVLIHPKGTIERPDSKKLDTRNIIKADQFASWHANFVEKSMPLTKLVGVMLNMRSQETMREWAEKIVRQHRSPDLLALPSFMKPREAPLVVPNFAFSPVTVPSEGVQKNQPTQKAPTPELGQEPYAKLTSSKVAQKMGLATQELLSRLVAIGCLEFKDGRHYLTDRGKAAGGEFRTGKHGSYFLWPDSLVLR